MLQFESCLCRYYSRAQQLVPKNGRPYNQLAVVAISTVCVCVCVLANHMCSLHLMFGGVYMYVCVCVCVCVCVVAVVCMHVIVFMHNLTKFLIGRLL